MMNKEEKLELRRQLGTGIYTDPDNFSMVPFIDYFYAGPTASDEISRYHTLDFIAENIIYKNNIPGVIVETGCFKCGIGVYLHKTFIDRDIYLFDSFDGLEPIADRQHSFPSDQVDHCFSSPLSECIKTLKKFNCYDERIHIIEGWFKNTTVNFDQKIAVLRFDGDTYSAALEVLTNMYDNVVDGGIVILDDSCIYETMEATEKFLIDRNIFDKIKFRSPYENCEELNFDKKTKICGMWWQKNENI
jgi:hypothetical protein